MASDFEPLRLGLIGCGGMGLRHALAVTEMQAAGCRAVEIVAVCDTDATRRTRIATLLATQQGRAPRNYAEAAQLLDDPAVEAVDVVLPTAEHHRVILAALEAGRHALVEKPLALTVSACDLIVAAAARSGRVVAVAENYRRLPGNRALGALIRAGSFGRLDAMAVRNFGPPEQPARASQPPAAAPQWYLDRSRAGGYHAMEMGVHEADLQEYWFGPVETVSATMQVYGGPAHPLASEDMLAATFRFASGFVSTLAFGSTMPGLAAADRLILGREASVTSGAWHEWQGGEVVRADGSRLPTQRAVAGWLGGLPAAERARLFPEGAWKQRPDGSVASDPLSYGVGIALHDFARAVRTGTAPEIPPEQARRAVAICCAMLEAARAGWPVRVEQILSGEISAAQAPLNDAIGVAA